MHIKYLIRKKPPILFPLVAVFHILVTLHAAWLFFRLPYDNTLDQGRLIDIMTMLLLSVLWFFVSDLRRWAGIGYIAVVAISMLLHYFTDFFGPKGQLTNMSPFFPADLLFCFFILAYYRRLS